MKISKHIENRITLADILFWSRP